MDISKLEVANIETGEIFKVPRAVIEKSKNITPRYNITIHNLMSLLMCGRGFEYRYVKGVHAPWPAKVGISIAFKNTILEYYSEKLNSRIIPIEELLDVLSSEWGEIASKLDLDFRTDEEDSRTADGWQKLAEELLELYIDKVAPTIIPLTIRKPFDIQIPGTEFILNGSIDLEAEDLTSPLGKKVIDIKFCGRKPSQQELDSDLEMSAFAWSYFNEDNRRTRPVEFEVHACVDRKNIVIKDEDILSTQRDRFQAGWFLEQATAYLNLMETGMFVPNSRSFMCTPKACGYWDICRGDTAKRLQE